MSLLITNRLFSTEMMGAHDLDLKAGDQAWIDGDKKMGPAHAWQSVRSTKPATTLLVSGSFLRLRMPNNLC